VGPVPGLEAEAAEDASAGPALKAGHADGRQVTCLAFTLDLK